MSAADDREKGKIIAAQWPKRCGCGKIYDRRIDTLVINAPHMYPWRSLPFAYNHTDSYSTQEARHCVCGSTLVVIVTVHNLKEE